MTCVDTLFLNEHSHLKKWFRLKKTSVKTLLNDPCGYLIFKGTFTAYKMAKIKRGYCEDLVKGSLSLKFDQY